MRETPGCSEHDGANRGNASCSKHVVVVPACSKHVQEDVDDDDDDEHECLVLVVVVVDDDEEDWLASVLGHLACVWEVEQLVRIPYGVDLVCVVVVVRVVVALG